MRAHRKGCYPCANATKNLRTYCDAGWEMAKRESRANYAVYLFKENEGKGQGTLW